MLNNGTETPSRQRSNWSAAQEHNRWVHGVCVFFKWHAASPEFISAAVLGGRQTDPHIRGVQRQQTALKPVQLLSGRRKGSCALCGQTTTSGTKACSLRARFDFPLPSSRLFSLSFRVLLRRRMFHQKVIIRRYYLTSHKHTTQLVEAVLGSFVSPPFLFLFFLILSKRNVRDY